MSFQLLSTTRYDPALLGLAWNTAAHGGEPSRYLLLRYHLDRLLDAANQHGWNSTVTYDTVRLACEHAVEDELHRLGMQDAPLRIRILLDYSNTISAAATLADPLPSPDPMSVSWVAGKPTEPMMRTLLDIRLDTCPTGPSLFTQTKTTHRLEYTAARARMSIPPLPAPSNADVLLYNPSGEITETSIRNVAFWRRVPPRWVTPHAEAGCLPGVMRRWLLEQGRIVEAQEGELVKDDLVEGEYILTFNGVEGCRIGRIALPSR